MRSLIIFCALGFAAACAPSAPSDGCRSAPAMMPAGCPGATNPGLECDDASMNAICRDGIVTPTDPANPSEHGQENCVKCTDAPGDAFVDGCYLSGVGYCVHNCSSC